MTFTEAAIEVLRREGKPLHFKKIAEIAIRENLLDHIGKIPEEVMGGQLANHCRLPHTDRHVMVVQPGTFALVEWGLDEDPQGLDGIVEPPPENELPYRGRERHPIPSKELARSTGRGAEQRARRREEGEERRGRRFPPPAEVAFEILAGANRPLTLLEIAAQGAERSLMPDAFVRDGAALAAALAEDNRRRESAGRKPLFAVSGDTVSLAAQPEPGERAAVAPVIRPTAPGDLRRTALAALRRRLRDCDGATLEHIAGLLLEKSGYREIKVAKRGREHVVYTARRKMGLADVRHCVRVMRGGAEISRRDVVELRRDIGNYGAQIGIVLSAGDAGREARGDAVAPGQLPVVLLAGDALAEAMAEAMLGCTLVVVPEIDEAFFKTAADTAAQEDAARKARRDERERRETEAREERRSRGEERARARQERRADEQPAPAAQPEAAAAEAAQPQESEAQAAAMGEAPVSAEPASAVAVEATTADASATEPAEGDEGEGEAEGEGDELENEGEAPAQEGAAPAAPGAAAPEGEPRKRRRRRRRRGGRGRGERRENAAGGAPESPDGSRRPQQAGSDAPASGAAPAPAPEAPTPESPRARPDSEGAGAPPPTAGSEGEESR